jgi:hypothetical protein
MAQYIDKDTLVAEIERLKECNRKIGAGNFEFLKENYLEHNCSTETYNDLLSFLDTLEVKEEFKIGETQIYLDDDGGEPPYDGKQWLDISCTEYEIPSDKFKDGDNVEFIIRKAQKGE